MKSQGLRSVSLHISAVDVRGNRPDAVTSPTLYAVPIESLRAEKTLFVRREKTFISSLSERRSVIVWMIYYTPVRDMNRSYF